MPIQCVRRNHGHLFVSLAGAFILSFGVSARHLPECVHLLAKVPTMVDPNYQKLSSHCKEAMWSATKHKDLISEWITS